MATKKVLAKPEPEVSAKVGKVMEWAALETENAALWTWAKATKHFLVTYKIARFAIVLNLIALAMIIVNTRSFCDVETGSCSEGYYGFRLIPLALLLVSLGYYLLVTGRIGVVTGIVQLIEGASLTFINILARAAAALIPDIVGNAFDAEEKFIQALTNARDEKAFEKKSKELLFLTMSLFAYIMTINVVLVTFTWLSQDLGSLMIMVLCVGALVFMIYGWQRPPFWMEKVQTFMMYLVAAILIYHLGFYKLLEKVSWGADTNFRILIWGLFFIIVAAIAFSGVYFIKDEETGKDGFELRWGVLGFALAVLFVGLLTLGPIVNFAQKNATISKFKTDLNDGKNPFSSGQGSSWFPTAFAATLPSSDNLTFVDAKSSTGVKFGHVKAGDKLEIRSSGIAIWKNIAVGNPTKYEETGPNGTSPTASNLMSANEYWSNINQYLCPTAKKGALIGKIGDGPWFFIGEHYKGEVRSTGDLTLAVNDVDPRKANQSDWDDNGKGFSVDIKVN